MKDYFHINGVIIAGVTILEWRVRVSLLLTNVTSDVTLLHERIKRWIHFCQVRVDLTKIRHWCKQYEEIYIPTLVSRCAPVMLTLSCVLLWLSPENVVDSFLLTRILLSVCQMFVLRSASISGVKDRLCLLQLKYLLWESQITQRNLCCSLLMGK